MSSKVGCSAETLRKWVRQSERDLGRRAGLTSTERERLKAPERENRELRRANEILRKARRISPRRSSTADPSHECFIDAEREAYGVEPICSVLPIAPSTTYEAKAREAAVAAGRSVPVGTLIARAHSPGVGGEFRCVRRSQGLPPASREGFAVARCTVRG